MLEQSVLYAMHKSVLDLPRGEGYWLWKPFLIKEVMKQLAVGDLLVFATGPLAHTLRFCHFFDISSRYLSAQDLA